MRNHSNIIKTGLTVLLLLSSLNSCSNSSSSDKNNSFSNTQMIIKQNRNVYDNGYIYTASTSTGLVNYFLDYETMETTPLCAIPNCEHKNSSCTAKAVGSCPVLLDDYIYYFTSSQNIEEKTDSRELIIDSKLMRIKISSSEIETVAEFHDCVPDTHDAFVIDNGLLYFQGDDMNPKEDEYGAITYTEAGGKHFICSIDLSTGKYKNYGSIYDEDKQYEAADISSSALISGIKDNNIVIDYSFLKKDIEDSEFMEEGFMMADKFTNVVVYFDLNKKTFEVKDNHTVSYIDNDTYVYYDNEKKSVVISDKNGERTISGTRSGLNSLVLNNKLWCYTDEGVFFDLSDMSRHETSGIANVIDFHNGKYIIKTRRNKFEALSEEDLLSK